MVNKTIIVGRLGNDPDYREEKGYCTFTIATSEKYKNKSGEIVEDTQWHSCIAWRKTAEIISKYAWKGSALYLECRLKYSEGEKDGVKVKYANLVVDKVQFLDKKDGSKQSQEPAKHKPAPHGPEEGDETDDLPF